MHLPPETRLYQNEPTISIHQPCEDLCRKRTRDEMSCSWRKTSLESIKRRRLAKKKSVGFAPTTTLIRRVVITDLPCTWYVSKEYRSFRRSMKQDIEVFHRSKDKTSLNQSTQHCIRGLERYCFPEEHETATAKKRQRIKAVLDQQLFQKAIGVHDDLIISVIAEIMAQRSCDHARKIGDMDSTP